MLNRGWRDVAAAILETAREEANQTMIMYNSFLSYTMLKEYVDLLIQAALLTYDKKTKLYRTTKQGIEFLELYNKMNKLVFPPKMKLRRHTTK